MYLSYNTNGYILRYIPFRNCSLDVKHQSISQNPYYKLCKRLLFIFFLCSCHRTSKITCVCVYYT